MNPRTRIAGLAFAAAAAVGLALPLTAPAGGDEAGNGAGIAENHFALAYSELDAAIDLCLGSGDCRLSSVEAGWLGEIRAALPAEYAAPGQLQFRSERREPGFFVIDGQLKIARTGSTVGSPIFLNVDLFYRRSDAGELVALNIETAASILVHELGHHHGIADHAALDALGTKVGSMLAARIQRVDLGPGRRHVVATVVDLDRRDTRARLIVSDGIRSFDLGGLVEKALSCPNGSKPGGFSLFNLHWRAQAEPAAEGELGLMGQLVLYCAESAPVEGRWLFVRLGAETDSLGLLRIRAGSADAWQAGPDPQAVFVP